MCASLMLSLLVLLHEITCMQHVHTCPHAYTRTHTHIWTDPCALSWRRRAAQCPSILGRSFIWLICIIWDIKWMRLLQRGCNVNTAVIESLKRHSRQSGSFIAILILWLSSKSKIYVVYQTAVHVSSAIRMREYAELSSNRSSYIVYMSFVLWIMCKIQLK